MVYRRVLDLLVSWVLVLSTPFGQSLSIARTSGTTHQDIVVDLIEDRSSNVPVHAALIAERVRYKPLLKSEAPQAIQSFLANLSLPLPPEVRELAAKAAASQEVTPEQAHNAAQQLNKMLVEQHHLLDLKVIDCREKRRRTGEAIQDAAKDVRSLASETSLARSIIIDASSRIPQDKRAFAEFKAEAKISHLRCQRTRLSDKVQAQSLERDAATIAALQTALSKQCAGKVSLAQLPGNSVHDVVADAEASIHAVHMLNAWPKDIPQPVDTSRPGSDVDDTIARAEGTLHAKPIVQVNEDRVVGAATCADMAAALGVVAVKRRPHASAVFFQEIQPAHCKLNRQTCAAMLDVAAEVSGEIADSQARLRASSARGRQACKDEEHFAKSQLLMETKQTADRARELGEATWRAGEAGDMANHKDSERQKLQSDLKAMTATCTAEISAILYSKMSAMQKVRDSLQMLAGSRDLAQDCQVSDWDEGVCSASCGGGTKTLTRQVTLSSNGGAACPALKLQLKCAETVCPLDCEISRWSGWSACSARCDGGVQERNRVVTTKPIGNGVACPNLVDMRLCNTDACSTSCELLQWTAWSQCSKACSAGTQVRSRRVKDEGNSHCPNSKSKDRLEFYACNEQQCNENKDSRCAGDPMDVVLLLDASGSITAPGFASLKALSMELAQRFAPNTNGTKLAVAAFAESAVAISGLSDDASQLAMKLSSDLQWIQGPGNAGSGLSRAASLLATGGQQKAASLVVMLTDGRLVDPFLARQAAEKLKKSGVRLVFAVVGTDYKNSNLLHSMASLPAKDNIIELPGLTELSAQMARTANRIVMGTCSAVV